MAVASSAAEISDSSLLKKGDRHLAAARFPQSFDRCSEPVPVFQQAVSRMGATDMCGISGIVDFEGPASPELVGRMLDRIRHRGPDGNGIFRDRGVALGHVRLSIIDVGGGGQPMHNEDQSLWITFNGEIFNYIELMADLKQRGHTFASRCDTEVILHAYEEYGEDCVRLFNG